MRTYRPGHIDPKDVNSIRREFESIQEAANRADSYIELQQLHAQPAKVFSGMTVLADGTDWNPGAGQGVYTYYASAWHKLG